MLCVRARTYTWHAQLIILWVLVYVLEYVRTIPGSYTYKYIIAIYIVLAIAYYHDTSIPPAVVVVCVSALTCGVSKEINFQ